MRSIENHTTHKCKSLDIDIYIYMYDPGARTQTVSFWSSLDDDDDDDDDVDDDDDDNPYINWMFFLFSLTLFLFSLTLFTRLSLFSSV